MRGSSEVFRSDEVHVTQLGVGGDFHFDNVRARLDDAVWPLLTDDPTGMMLARARPWNLDNAYRYLSEAYGGYHFNRLHGIKLMPDFHVIHWPLQLLQLR